MQVIGWQEARDTRESLFNCLVCYWLQQRRRQENSSEGQALALGPTLPLPFPSLPSSAPPLPLSSPLLSPALPFLSSLHRESAVSSPNGVWGGAPADKRFGAS